MKVHWLFQAVVLVFTSVHCNGLSSPNKALSRREFLLTSAVTTTGSTFLPRQDAWASSDDVSNNNNNYYNDYGIGPPERQNLLRKITTASEEEMLYLISQLEPLDPSGGKATLSEELGGTWELIYSVNAQAFSPLLNLPRPIRPKSIQLLGKDAADKVGEGRVAQVLNFTILPLSLILSSGAVPRSSDPTTLEIFPPFRLQAKLAGTTFNIVESGSDADFRALNARDEEAQAAGRNMYKQRYLETTGKRGDLRISEVVSGDPVIVGAVFIHRRL